MSTILDIPEQKPIIHRYLRKSILVYLAYVVLIVLITGAFVFRQDSWKDGTPELDAMHAFVGLTYFVMVLLSPFGLYFIIKAWQKKEGRSAQRIAHTVGHGIMFVLLVIMVVVIVVDVSKVM